MTIQQILLGAAAGKVVGQEVLLTDNSSQGTDTWTCPAGVTSVSVVCVGAGAKGSGYNGGGGGALSYRNNCTVVPGTTYTYEIGIGGGETGSVQGGDSYYQGHETYIQFESGTSNYCYANGGTVDNTQDSQSGCVGGAAPTSAQGDGGGQGGGGGTSSHGYAGGGGGGAGGYDGKGGTSGYMDGYWSASYHGTTSSQHPQGKGGGASAGGNRWGGGNGGGGVGLLGEGTSGAAPAGDYSSAGGNLGLANGGSGGGDGIEQVDGVDTYRRGCEYGGGGGGGLGIGNGGDGAIRIIWPGDERSFPTTRTADES
tara:strand:+ start:18009 stop:18941 length:933 start_codon:yes stop_codon:yes gene_type:complete